MFCFQISKMQDGLTQSCFLDLMVFNMQVRLNFIYFQIPGSADKKPVIHLRHSHTVQKIKFSIQDFFSKVDQIPRKLRIWSHLLKKSLMENFILFCSVSITIRSCNCHHSLWNLLTWKYCARKKLFVYLWIIN